MKYSLLISLCMAPLVVGCLDGSDDTAEITEEVATQNGLATINGLTTKNGLKTQNGLSTDNGLKTQNGLKDGVGMMSSSGGRDTLAYLVKCALPAGRAITKKDQTGKSYTFSGALGVAPEWEAGACGTTCQQWISACMVAHINTAGVHIPLWVVSDQPQIGWSLSASYPLQEGSFFGNIFVSPPVLNYCNGRNFDVNAVPGRIGYDTSTKPYVNPWGYNTYCDTYCTPADIPNRLSGYKACAGYNSVFTVWRQ